MSEKIKIGIIGIGHVANYQLEAIKKTTLFDLIALCDNDESKCKNNIFDKPFYTDYKEMLNNHNFDAIVISVPNISHFEITDYLIGKIDNILLEKPATLTMKHFDLLAKKSLECSTNLVIAYHAKFALDLLWFVDNYENKLQKELGDIIAFRCDFFDPYIDDKSVLSKNAEKLNGSWIDSGINALSVVSRIIDSSDLFLESFFSTNIPSFNCSDIQCNANFLYRLNNKLYHGQINTNWSLSLNRKTTHLFFENGNYIILHHSLQQVLRFNYKNERSVIADFSNEGERLVNHYSGVFNDFYERIKNNNNNIELSRKLHSLLLNKKPR